MTDIQKNDITLLVQEEKARLGSLKNVAVKCGVSEATISQILNSKTELIADRMWIKIGSALGWKTQGWQVVETTNTKILFQVFADAKEKSLFMAVSHRAGSGKTVSSNAFAGANYHRGVYLLRCREWDKRQFLGKMCQELGLEAGHGYATTDDLIEKVIRFFQERTELKPLLIIDEADKLRPAALRCLIPLYNELEARLGIVILGTDNLEKEIKRGVRYDQKGYDEIDSRFGRNFIHLVGATAADIRKICEANGIETPEMYRDIFKEAEPRQVMVSGRSLEVVEDLRRVRRAVERELLRSITAE